MTRALLIGASGFIGRHVAAALSATDVIVIGAGRHGPPVDWTHEWVSVDLADPAGVSGGLARSAPDVVFQLAGAPQDDLDQLLAVNVAGTSRLLDEVGTQVRVVIAGSAAEYGEVPAHELPVTESAASRAVSQYGIAKAAQTAAALESGADVVIARLFNLSGPGEPPTLVAGAFAGQIVELERQGAGGEIAVGALDPERDFVDVRDAARALVTLAERGSSGQIYNVCSGAATSIGEVLSTLAGLARVPVRPRVDPQRAGRPGVARIFGSVAKLRAATGWSPSFALADTLADLLDERRAQADGA